MVKLSGSELLSLMKLTRRQLAELLITTRQRLTKATLKLAMARVTISDQTESKRIAVNRYRSTVKSLRQTVKRRRKHG